MLLKMVVRRFLKMLAARVLRRALRISGRKGTQKGFLDGVFWKELFK